MMFWVYGSSFDESPVFSQKCFGLQKMLSLFTVCRYGVLMVVRVRRDGVFVGSDVGLHFFLC